MKIILRKIQKIKTLDHKKINEEIGEIIQKLGVKKTSPIPYIFYTYRLPSSIPKYY